MNGGVVARVKPWLRIVSDRPVPVLLACTAFTLFALAGIVDPRTGEPRLVIDPSTDRLLPSKGPERDLYERARRLFGTDEAIVVALGAEDVFTTGVLERIERLTRSLERVEGVHHVVSLASTLNVRSVAGELVIAPFYEEPPTDPKELERLRGEVLGNPIYAGSLASEDSRSAAILVYLDRMSDRELIQRRLDERIEAIVFEEVGDSPAWISGTPHVKAIASRLLMREMSWMLPAILALLALVLALAMGSLRAMAIPLCTIAMALVWTLGLVGWLGQSLNVVTTLVPSLILIIGFAYSMHIVSDYYAVVRAVSGANASNATAATSRQVVRETLAQVTTPVLATGVTTTAGFLALSLHPIVAIREFGMFSMLGVAFAVVSALTFGPAVLALLPLPRRTEEPRLITFLDPLADRLARSAAEHRTAWIVAGVAVLAVALAGVPRIRVATESTTSFREGHRVLDHYEEINERLGGANELQVLLETDVVDAFLSPRNLLELQALQQWLSAQPEIGATSSIADYVMLLNRALHDDDPVHLRIPDSEREISQLLFFGASPETKRFVDARHRIANVLVRATVSDSESISRLVARIQARLAKLPQHLRGSVTGSGVLLSASVDDVARGQGVGLLVAYALIYAVLVLTFTSFRVALLALLPNVLPIAVYFGALGYFGITLNPSTSLIGCLALGIAVDDTIHYFTRFNAEAKQRADERVATATTLRALIRPVSLTTVGLCLGFLVLTLSELRTQAEFGLLAAFTLAVAWLSDVTVTPALCSGVRIVTLWDVMTLDLGPDPHRSIALFEGLTARQARIFALMSDIRSMEAGQRLMSEGDVDRNIYVVLDGSLVSSLRREGSSVELAKLGRGDTVGEVGYFGGQRSADVDATSETRLIRFDSEDLENLRRRYPRIAAAVYRNLNRIQAERLVRTTARLR